MMEAYRLGKPVLISDSEWNGGRDYFHDRAAYFKHDSEEDFDEALLYMNKRAHDLIPATDCKQWIETNYSDKRMVDDMIKRITVTS